MHENTTNFSKYKVILYKTCCPKKIELNLKNNKNTFGIFKKYVEIKTPFVKAVWRNMAE